MPLTPVMRAPAAERSAVGPFFESSNPRCGSPLLGLVARSAAVVFAPPLSGNPAPPSHAAVTIREPAGEATPGVTSPQSPAPPTKTNGSALRRCSLSPSSATAFIGTLSTMAMVKRPAANGLDTSRFIVISPVDVDAKVGAEGEPRAPLQYDQPNLAASIAAACDDVSFDSRPPERSPCREDRRRAAPRREARRRSPPFRARP